MLIGYARVSTQETREQSPEKRRRTPLTTFWAAETQLGEPPHCVRSRLRRMQAPQRSSETPRLACKIAPICLIPYFQVEPRNILHACEFNPFEAYKQVFGAIARYRFALRQLDGCKAYVSPLSSKLLSVGALLACYDHKSASQNDRPLIVGMPCVEAVSYGDVDQSSEDFRELYSMWIRGEWER